MLISNFCEPSAEDKRKLLILIVSPTFPLLLFAIQNKKKEKKVTKRKKSLMQNSQKVIPIFPAATYRIGETFQITFYLSTTNSHINFQPKTFFSSN